MSLEDDPVIFN